MDLLLTVKNTRGVKLLLSLFDGGHCFNAFSAEVIYITVSTPTLMNLPATWIQSSSQLALEPEVSSYWFRVTYL